ncbi:MAG: MBL fold metallo-hydrolase RNA specificity domain-containing protein [Bacteroidota bacterium]|jgi:metallo-beta-lactamase family protein
MQIDFYGAAKTVTGSKHLITTPAGKKILLDCGLFQGRLPNRDDLNRHFGFDPTAIDCVVLSHAHIDHSGLLPALYRNGFRGTIYSTPATRSLCELMLFDSAHIQQDDLEYINARRRKNGGHMLTPLYDVEDVENVLNRFSTADYGEHLKIDNETTIHFTDAGHLLGSAAVHLDIKKDAHNVLKITYTGDIGRPNDPILRNPTPFRQPDILICESTYGNRLHPTAEKTEQTLLQIVHDVCVSNLGKLIIPAFSVDRTQELVYTLEKMFNSKLLPNIKIYVDSPLSVKATEVMKKHEECYNPEFLEYMHKHDPYPFAFSSLTYISDVEQSKLLNTLSDPCIIISASGMAEAGRIKHHIKNTIENPNCAILMVGYCTPESLGGQLMAGRKTVRIFGEEFQVKARVIDLEYFSSHADYSEIISYLSCIDPGKIQRTFLVHGEYEAALQLKERMLDKGFRHIHIPELKESCSIDV